MGGWRTENFGICVIRGTVCREHVGGEERDIGPEKQNGLQKKIVKTERRMKWVRLTFIPRLVRNMLQAVQLRIHTLCATGGKGKGLRRWSGTGIGLTSMFWLFSISFKYL